MGGFICEEGFQFIALWRQAGEGESKSSQSRDAIGQRGRLKALAFEFRLDETIHRMDGIPLLDRPWNLYLLWWLQTPPFTPLGKSSFSQLAGNFSWIRRLITRIWRAALNPLSKITDHRVGQLLVGRHFEGLMFERGNQQAFLGFAGDQNRS